MSHFYQSDLLIVYAWREGDHLIVKWRSPILAIWTDVDRRFGRSFGDCGTYRHLLRRWHLPLTYQRRLEWWLLGVVSTDAVRWCRPPTHSEMRREQELLERQYAGGVR